MKSVLVEMGMISVNIRQTENLLTEPQQSIEQFNLEAIFVSRLYTRCLSKWKPKNLRKITIEIVDSVGSETTVPSNRFTQACILYTYFEIGSWKKELNQIIRYKILLDLIFKALIDGAKRFSWDSAELISAYEKVIALNFVNEFVLILPLNSLDRNWKSSVKVRVEKNESAIFLEVKNSVSLRKLGILKVAQVIDEFEITKNMKWINDNELLISDKEEEIHFKYEISENQVLGPILTPKSHSCEYLEDELMLLDPSTSKEKSLAIRNKRISELMMG